MKAKVTEEGLVIPKELLAGILEVEIFTENRREKGTDSFYGRGR